MKSWRIWIDTGGTFTDGVGIAPDGSVRRSKILSSSALRGTVSGRLKPERFEIQESWPGAADVVQGLAFRMLGREHAPRSVRSYDPATHELELDGPLDAAPGATFEIVSEEESPVFSARLLTGTPAPGPLPPTLIRLASGYEHSTRHRKTPPHATPLQGEIISY